MPNTTTTNNIMTISGSPYSTLTTVGNASSSSSSTYSLPGHINMNGSYIYATGPSYTGIANTTFGNITANELTLDGVKINETLKSIQDRLAILTPNLEKHEKFAALKAAYQHYLLLEKLCSEPDNNDTNT